MIVDVPNSSVVLAVQQLAKEKNRVLIVSAGGTADLTGKACSPTGIHWTWDTYAVAVSTARAIVEEGGDSWFFLTADYAFGHAMERDVSHVVMVRRQGRATVKHPLNTPDFCSFLLQAQASKAKIIALANGGRDTSTRSSKRASSASPPRRDESRWARDLHHRHPRRGPGFGTGLLLTTGFYWDRTRPRAPGHAVL